MSSSVGNGEKKMSCKGVVGLFRAAVVSMVVAVALVTSPLAAEKPLVFISSFATGEAGAIHAFRLDLERGALAAVNQWTDVENPFFLALSDDGNQLYSIHAPQFGGPDHSDVAAYAILDANGKLELLNRQTALGTTACYLDVSAGGRTVVVANYGSGSVASFPVNRDGSLKPAATFVQHQGMSVNPTRQQAPHAHCFVISPDNRFVFSADLGTDQIIGYRLAGRTSELMQLESPAATAPGAGPRHLTFHPSGKYVYVINELLNTVSLFDYDTKTGKLTKQQTIATLPEDFKGTSHTADLKITPDGKFLYGTNRGHDSIACFRLSANGRLSKIAIVPSLGKGPQNLAIAGAGQLLICANMPGNNVAIFKIDSETGSLTSVGKPVELTSPSCIMIR